MNIEADIFKSVNLARQYPTYYVALIEEQLNQFQNDYDMAISSTMVWRTQEGRRLWNQAKSFLIQQSPIRPLQFHKGLALAAQDHIQDLCQNGFFSHTGSDNSTFHQRISRYCQYNGGKISEMIGADFIRHSANHAQMIVLSLIIDDGNLERGHRNTIFDPNFNFIGLSNGLQQDKSISVFNLSERNCQPKLATANNFKSSLKTFRGAQHNKPLSRAQYPCENNGRLKTILGSTRFKTNHLSTQQEQDGNEFAQNRSQNDSSGSLDGKLFEKIVCTRTKYERGHRKVQTITQRIFKDGTVEENIKNRIYYL